MFQMMISDCVVFVPHSVLSTWTMTSTGSLMCSLLLTSVVISTSATNTVYKILLLPLPAKSHVFPMFTFGEVLAGRGHDLTIVLSENLPLDIPEQRIGQRRGIRIERHKDTVDDFQSTLEHFTSMFLENRIVSFREQIPLAISM